MKLHSPEKVDGTEVRIGKRIRHQRIDGVKHDVVTSNYVAHYKMPGGKWSHESLQTSNKREARRKAIEIQARLDKGQDRIVFRAVKIGELIDQYEKHCVAKGLAPKSLSKYRSDLEKLRRFCSAKRISLAGAFDEDDFHRFRAWLQQQKHKQGVTYSPKSVGSALLVCKQVFKYGWQRKVIPTYTLAAVPLPKAKARPQPCFTTSQVETLLERTEGEEQAVLATLAYAGFRIGEAEQLLWDDVLFDRGELGMFHIRRGGSNGTTKNKQDRFVPIHPRIRPLLEGLGRRQGLVFPTTRERRLLARLKGLCRQAGFTAPDQYKLHSFRHHFASMCANHHVAHRKALAWMGHSSSQILDLYYHLSDAESESAMKALAAG